MDISVAVIQPKQHYSNEKLKLLNYDPANFELLIAEQLQPRTVGEFVPEPSVSQDPRSSPLGQSGTSNRPASLAIIDKGSVKSCQNLPRCRMSFDQEPSEVALGESPKIRV